MASFMRASRQGCRLLTAYSTRNVKFVQPSCLISTSKKNKDTIAATESSTPPTQEKLLDKEENWISYGYSLTDRDFDEFAHKSILFMAIVVLFGFGGLYVSYFPDFRMRDWSQREAYLELARRESAGEPLISADYISVDKIDLPSDDELGDTEIII